MGFHRAAVDALPAWTPPSGTLSSPKNATREKGELIVKVSGDGIHDAVASEFGV